MSEEQTIVINDEEHNVSELTVETQMHVARVAEIRQEIARLQMQINERQVVLNAYGEAIVNAPSGEQIFGATPPPLMGGSVMPMGGAFPGVPQQPTIPQPMGNMILQQPVTPNYGVLPQAMQPQQPVAPQQPATTPGFAMPPQFGGNGQR